MSAIQAIEMGREQLHGGARHDLLGELATALQKKPAALALEEAEVTSFVGCAQPNAGHSVFAVELAALVDDTSSGLHDGSAIGTFG